MAHYNIVKMGQGHQALETALATMANADHHITQIDKGNYDVAAIPYEKTDLILLSDLNDQRSSLQWCREIKKHKQTKRLPVIIATSRHDLDQIISGFDSGAFDIISDQCEPDEIQARIEAAIRIYHTEKKLEDKVKRAKEAAFNAMEDSNKLGLIIQFMERSASCTDFVGLSKLTFDVLKECALSGSVVFHGKERHDFYSDDETERTNELELMQKFNEHVYQSNSTDGRFKTFASNIIATSPNASLLIRNAPDSESTRGRLRDLLGALINGLDASAQRIGRSDPGNRHCALTEELIQETHYTIQALENMVGQGEQRTLAVINALFTKANEGFQRLDLTDEQDTFFMSLMETTSQELAANYTEGVLINRHFQHVVDNLNKLKSAL